MGTLAEGIKEIFATAKTTGSNVMLCGNDGNPDGHMTMANLASVLGELPGGLYNSLNPFNIDTFYNGMVSLNNSTSQNITGVCPQTDMRGSLYSQCSLVYDSRFGTQTFVYFSNNSSPIIVYKRNLWADDWSAWQRCDNFGCNTLSDLANALGALHWVGQIESASQLDTLQAQTITYLGDSIVVTIGHGTNANYRFQFKLHDSGAIDVRNTTGGDSAWKSWITWFTR